MNPKFAKFALELQKATRMTSEEEVIRGELDLYKEIAAQVFDKMDMPSKIHQITWEFTTSIRVAGQAFYGRNKIELSIPLLYRMPFEKRKEIVIHEACHIAAFHRYGDTGHGKYWAHCMITCGVAPERCHTTHANDIRLETAKIRAATNALNNSQE